MNKVLIIYILLPALMLFGFKSDVSQKTRQDQLAVEAIHLKENYVAGERIELGFRIDDDVEYRLLLRSSYGNVLLKANSDQKDKLLFTVPSFLSKKKGIVHYNLISNHQVFYTGSLQISASHKKQNR